MNINRHNYEEYFILYMDNELSSDDRRMVEAFVQQHPDLKEELDILLQYKLEPDASVVFNGKEELMKVNGETPISLSNYEEWLVLYTDNELTATQRKSIEQFAAANPAVKDELDLLMKARLQPEEIVFPYKESLYRKEERRVVPFRWWRAAAAIFIIALGITSVLVFNNKPGGIKKGEVADVTPGSEKNNNPVTKEQQTGTTNSVVSNKQTETVNETAVTNTTKQSFPATVKQTDKNIAVKNNKPAFDKKMPGNNPVISNKNEEQVIAKNEDNKPTNNLPEPLNNPNINKKDLNDATAAMNTDKEPANLQEPLTNPAVTNVIPAAYKSTEDANQLEEGSNNKKSRGLFRKIARTFEKRTNMPATDDNRLLVGGLSFKLK